MSSGGPRLHPEMATQMVVLLNHRKAELPDLKSNDIKFVGLILKKNIYIFLFEPIFNGQTSN